MVLCQLFTCVNFSQKWWIRMNINIFHDMCLCISSCSSNHHDSLFASNLCRAKGPLMCLHLWLLKNPFVCQLAAMLMVTCDFPLVKPSLSCVQFGVKDKLVATEHMAMTGRTGRTAHICVTRGSLSLSLSLSLLSYLTGKKADCQILTQFNQMREAFMGFFSFLRYSCWH